MVNAAGIDKYLFYPRQLVQSDLAAHALIDRDVAPAKYRQPFSSQCSLHGLAGCLLQCSITTQEKHANRVVLSQIDIEHGFGFGAHEGVGHLQQQTAAIPRAAIGGNTAAVGHTG